MRPPRFITPIIFAVVLGGLLLPAFAPVQAACPTSGGAAGPAIGSLQERLKRIAGCAGYSTQDSETGLAQYVGLIIKAAMSLLGVIFVAQMVYAGYLWMTARDEADQLEKAKHIIRRSIVGLAIILGAWAVTNFVLSRLFLAAQGTL